MEALTVQQLIDELNKIENKGKIVYIRTEDFSYITKVSEYVGTIELT